MLCNITYTTNLCLYTSCVGVNCWLCIRLMGLGLHLRATVASGAPQKHVNASWERCLRPKPPHLYAVKISCPQYSATENVCCSKTERDHTDQDWGGGVPAVIPVAPGRCFCRRGDVSWSSGEETPHTPLLMKQTGPLTCCCWTASYGSKI